MKHVLMYSLVSLFSLAPIVSSAQLIQLDSSTGAKAPMVDQDYLYHLKGERFSFNLSRHALQGSIAPSPAGALAFFSSSFVPWAMTQDQENIYIKGISTNYSAATGTLRAYSKTTGEMRILSSNLSIDLGVLSNQQVMGATDSFIYFCNDSLWKSHLMVARKDGSAPAVAVPNESCGTVAAINNSVYWVTLEGKLKTFRNGAPAIIASLRSASGAMVVNSTHAFLLTTEGLNKVDLATGKKVILAKDRNGLNGLALDDQRVYFTVRGLEVDKGSVKSINHDGSGLKTIISGLYFPRELAVDSNFVYFNMPSKGLFAHKK